MKKLLFDRRDGRRIKPKDPIMRLIPYIMPKRYDAQVFFEDSVDLTETEKTIKQLRKEGHRVIFLHVVLATMLRTMVDFPKANRFVKGSRVYARKDITFSFAIKRAFELNAEETVIKITFDRKDTLIDVVNRVNEAIAANKVFDGRNKTDRAARLLNLLPGFMIRGALMVVNFMDNHRLMPKFLINASPFHTSAFVTDLGSLGIQPVFHHIYDFGTTTFFFAFGTKKRHAAVDRMDNIRPVRQLDYKIVIDERIGDGFYMATVIKRTKKYLKNPLLLMDPPESIPVDDEIR
ncbi:MAG: hypothetical protein EA374_08730 [Acholeplasmatales bacterium]|nr:MAG: hypothetical protein EA374_08730 [Acholeplasmatales bacterium]